MVGAGCLGQTSTFVNRVIPPEQHGKGPKVRGSRGVTESILSCQGRLARIAAPGEQPDWLFRTAGVKMLFVHSMQAVFPELLTCR